LRKPDVPTRGLGSTTTRAHPQLVEENSVPSAAPSAPRLSPEFSSTHKKTVCKSIIKIIKIKNEFNIVYFMCTTTGAAPKTSGSSKFYFSFNKFKCKSINSRKQEIKII
jgi:hypothetical protein